MAMRDLITGGAACAVPGGAASSANPFGALANAVLGSSSKAQELKGLPGAAVNISSSSSEFRPEFPLTTIPGSEHESERYQQVDGMGSEFLNSFRSADNGGLADAWGEIYQPHILQPQSREGPPQRVLSQFLHSFVDSGRADVPFRPAALPVLGLSESDKQCIRDRSCIISRHIFSDKSEEYINAQVNSLLHSLDIDSNQHLRGPVRGHYPELEEYWNESQGLIRTGVPSLPDRWVSEFGQQSEHGNPDAWVHSFDQMHGANDWASEFEQSQFASSSHIMRGVRGFAAMEQSRMFGHALVQNTDPKFQNSKFLQFVPKMSHGELFIDENQIKPATGSLSGTWAEEYQNQYDATRNTWADQFARQEILHETNTWVKEYAKERQAVDDEWVSEFSKLHVQDWADEFGQQVAEGAFGESSVNDWADGYERFMEEQVLASKQQSKAGIYVFSDMNPYVGHPKPLKEGKELFHKGLLSEAVLALEAEVLKNSDNAEGWRLLGITHAENDDDQQAIAAMMRAHEADPSNLEVLLALGVSHTNELDQKEALSYLHRWLQNHTKYGHLVSAGSSGSLYHGDVTRLFNEAAEMSPEDADLHIVLGVLYNLSREYDKAIESFKRALQFKPQDYSLWNKLGATQANSIHSADAILAYQQALDLKPNYVRAWANMGISYSNQGLYDDSIRYYVRALAMNPKADNVWQYLRISLSVSSRNDMFQACDSRNLDALQKEFPL